MSRPVITTSWDDGHPLDLRIAALLVKYDLPGTFYVPRHPRESRLAELEIRDMAGSFEIGAHTVSHRPLTQMRRDEVEPELADSKSWIEEVTGSRCRVFAFPHGRFAAGHVRAVLRAGFTGSRTTELLSLSAPARIDGLAVLPTTVQAYPHSLADYARNILRRRAFRNLGVFLRCAGTGPWTHSLKLLIPVWRERGAVLHLWGHAWEIEATDGWSLLEDALKMLRDFRQDSRLLSNGDLCALAD